MRWAALLAFLWPTVLAAQQTPILEIRINQGLAIIVEAEGTYLQPLLPVQVIREFTGFPPGNPGYVSVEQLEAILGVQVEYSPAHALVTIRDPLGVLPVLAEARSQAFIEARMQQGQFGGPFAFAEVNQAGSYRLGTGMSGRRYSAALYHSSVGRSFGRVTTDTRWRVQVSPIRNLWLSYTDGEDQSARFGARTSYPGGFVSAGYTEGAKSPALTVAGSRGRVSAIVETPELLDISRLGGAITYTSRINITVGYSEDVLVGRMAIGSYYPSPFTVPRLQ